MESNNSSQSTEILDQSDINSQPVSPEQNTQNDLDQPNKRPRKRAKRKLWPIDNSIKLLETRKEMEETFRCVYHASEAWIKLVNKCGWTMCWKNARDKFQNLKREGAHKKLTPTGISGDFVGNEKKVKLFELVNYFLEKSHKYKPPKLIDTSDIDQATANEQQINDDHAPIDDLDPANDDFNFSSLTEADIHREADALPDYGSTQNSTQDTFNNSSQETISPIDRSLIDVRKRLKRVTSRDIALRSAEAIDRISDNHEKLTNATMDYFEFNKEMKLETFKRSYGIEFNRKA